MRSKYQQKCQYTLKPFPWEFSVSKKPSKVKKCFGRDRFLSFIIMSLGLEKATKIKKITLLRDLRETNDQNQGQNVQCKPLSRGGWGLSRL